MSLGNNTRIIKEAQKPERSVPQRYFLVCMLGLLLFTTGLMVATGAKLFKEERYDYYYHSERTGVSAAMQISGVMLAEFGIGILIIGLLAAGFMTDALTPQTRAAFLGSSFGLVMMLLLFTLIFGLT